MNLLFDLDGTLTDPEEGITRCIALALADAGAEPPPPGELARYIGPPLMETFASLLGDEAAAHRAVARYREEYAVSGLFQCRLVDGIAAGLERLREHCLYVVTAKPTVYAERIVAHFGLAAHFLAVHGSELSGRRSRKTELIAHVLEVEQLDRADTVMIGDRRDDVVGARGNALASIGVLWGFGSRAELVEAGASRLCDEVSALPSVLDTLGGA